MQEYIVQARCMFSGYTDVFKVQASNASSAVEKWSKDQFAIAGIITDVRYGKVIACKLEHFKPGNVRADNAPVNTAKMGSGKGMDVKPLSHASKAERKEAQEIIDAMVAEAKFAKANRVSVDDIYWDENDKLQVVDANEPPPF
tara:strand:- start:24047 stop:24475 length:429 start_codon:yes stop_codon:yes gene_type:complete